MAIAHPLLIEALRSATRKLETHADYQWGHMGSCNCGHLAQHLLKLNKDEIHEAAMERSGDWTEHLNDYCPSSGLRMDQMIDELLKLGLSRKDLQNLERLSDPQVLKKAGKGYLLHNKREDVIAYLKAWSSLMEEEWASIRNTPAEVNRVLETEWYPQSL
jgi:hypothetical protein